MAPAVSGEGARRRRGESWGKARGTRELPWGGFGWARDGRRRQGRGSRQPAAALLASGGSLAVLGGGGRARELQ